MIPSGSGQPRQVHSPSRSADARPRLDSLSMDEYQQEIREIEEQIDVMTAAEEDPKEIAELQMQLNVLRAIYHQASALLGAGDDDSALRESLALRGYGSWNIDNVYAFVYESAIDLPAEGHRSFVGEIRETDFGGLLAEPA